MLAYLLKRIFMLIPLFIGITLITFVVIHLAPGEPVEMQTALNPKASAKSRERMREFYGLDKPLHVQYVNWLGRWSGSISAVLLLRTADRSSKRSPNGFPSPSPSISSP